MRKILILLSSIIVATLTISKITAVNLQQGKQNLIELNLYYKNNKADPNGEVIFNDWSSEAGGWQILSTFNLSSNSIFNYKKISFLGNDSDFYSKVSWGYKAFHSKKLNDYNDSELDKRIINAKIINKNDALIHFNNKNKSCFLLQDFQIYYRGSSLHARQQFALTWYYENNNFYLQVLIYQFTVVTNSLIGGGLWLGIGTGIKLYSIL